jgi:hypothetical protein
MAQTHQSKPSRSELADAALKAATELGILIHSGSQARTDRISHFRDVLHLTTEGWLDEHTGRLTDALTARLYFDAIEQTKGHAAETVEDFRRNVKQVVETFDRFGSGTGDQNALQEMMNFALAFHTLLISEAYSRLSNWKHQGLL